MKHLVIILSALILLASCTTPPEQVNHSTAIKAQANAMGQSILNKDYKGFSKFMHPKVLQLVGGEQGMITVLQNGAADMDAAGTTFLNVKFGEPTATVLSGTELQCTLLQTTEIKVPDGIMVSKSTLIASSTDEGKTWCFMDTAGQDLATLKQTIPNLSDKLVIPEKEEPTMKME